MDGGFATLTGKRTKLIVAIPSGKVISDLLLDG